MQKGIYWSGDRNGQAELDPELGDSGFSITLFLFLNFFLFFLLWAGSLAYVVLTYNPKRKEIIFSR